MRKNYPCSALFALLLSSQHTLAEITISEGFVRAAPPGASMTAAFMTLSNKTATAVHLTGASSPAAKATELHNHITHNGVMQMRQVDTITIAAQSKTTLKPGGHHLMLIGLNRNLKPGEQIPFILRFSDQSEQQITLPVQRPQPHPSHDDAHHQPMSKTHQHEPE